VRAEEFPHFQMSACHDFQDDWHKGESDLQLAESDHHRKRKRRQIVALFAGFTLVRAPSW
jgi:hypothetical protein